MQLQQLTRLAGSSGQQQQQRPQTGWVAQLADGGVLVPMPADGLLQEDGGLLGGLDPLEELMMGGRVGHMGADEDLKDLV